MTLEPDTLPDLKKPKSGIEGTEKTIVFENLFSVGYTVSDKLMIFHDEEKNVKIEATFRTLTPPEMREVWDICNRFESFGAREITEKIEILARAITSINDMPLILDPKERDDFKGRTGQDPSPLEQARIIMIDKLKSTDLLEALWEVYEDFRNEIRASFEEIKKKSRDLNSSKPS